MNGDNWFSITNELANYVLNQKHCLKEQYAFTKSPDEIFLQTIVYNSNFKNQANVQLSKNNNQNISQKFYVTYLNNGYYSITAAQEKASGRLLAFQKLLEVYH